jgi:hypothetical protein
MEFFWRTAPCSIPARRRRTIHATLIVFMVFMASGLALLSLPPILLLSGMYTYKPLVSLAGGMFAAALLAELTAIVLAYTRAGQARPGSNSA